MKKLKDIKNHIIYSHDKIKQFIIILFSLLLILTVFAFIRTNTLRVLLVILSILPCYVFSKYAINYLVNYINTDSEKKFVIYIRLFFCYIFSAYIYLSFYHKFIGIGKIAMIGNLGLLVIMSILLFMATNFLTGIKINSIIKGKDSISNRKKILIFVALSFFPITVGTIIFLGYFPGSMNIDFFVVYEYIVNSSYTDAHPIMYTMLLKLLSLIYSDLPVTLSIFHILLSSFTYTYIAYRLNKMGLSLLACSLLVVLLTLTPANFYINSMLWKDVVYTMFLLLFSIEVLRLFVEEKYFSKISNIALFFLFGFFVLVARHNGQYVLFLFAIIIGSYYLIKSKWKAALISICILGSILCSFYITKAITIKALGDKYTYHPYTSNVIYSTAAQGMLVLYIDHYDELNDSQRESIEFFIDIDKVRHRNESIDEQGWAFDMWKFKNDGAPFLLLNNVEKSRNSFFSLYLELCNDYPHNIFDAYMKNTALAWSSIEYEYTYAMDLNINEPFGGTEIKIEQNIILNNVNIIMDKLADFLTGNDLMVMLFFRPAFMFILIIFVILISKRRTNAIFLSLPVLLNHFGYFLGCSAQDTRYMYGNYSLLYIVLFYVLFSNTIINNKSNENK